VHPFASHYTDVSRCTISKILKIKYISKQILLLRSGSCQIKSVHISRTLNPLQMSKLHPVMLSVFKVIGLKKLSASQYMFISSFIRVNYIALYEKSDTIQIITQKVNIHSMATYTFYGDIFFIMNWITGGMDK
jgi:hypothetical protein